MLRQKITPRSVILCAIIFVISAIAVLPITAQDTGGDSTTSIPATYVIQRGDVLDVLAQQWNISLDALMKANDYTYNTILRIGDTIIVPQDAPPYGTAIAIEDTTAGAGGGGIGGAEVSGEVYIIQRNDVLDTIGQRYDVSVEALIDANNITNTKMLKIGQTIIIPDDAPAYGQPLPISPAVTDTTAGAGGGASGDIYIVQLNDTLDGIAADYNVDTDCLGKSNNLKKPGMIFPGQEIVIDTSCPAYTGFDVVGGADNS